MTVFRGFGNFAVGAALTLGLVSCATSDVSEADMAATADAIHARVIVLDGHADIAMPETASIYLGADGKSQVTPAKLKAGGVNAIVMSIAAGPQPRTPEGDAKAAAEAADKLKTILLEIENNPSDLALAKTADEVRSIRESGKTAIILGFQNAQSLERDLSRLDDYYAAGVRVFGLTHLGHNDFADSSRPKYDGETRSYEATEHHGLSALGKAAVAKIDGLGGIIDVSQTSKAATLQAIELATHPVIASHSNVKALSDVTRNLSDEELDRIGETGGVVHIAAFSAYLVDLTDPVMLGKIRDVRVAAGLPEAYAYPYELYWELEDVAEKMTFLTNMTALVGQEDVSRLVDHIDYVVDRIGIEHVGIGTDFNHGGGIVGFDEADSAGAVTLELVKRGYSEADIAKIWGGNFLRVLEASGN